MGKQDSMHYHTLSAAMKNPYPCLAAGYFQEGSSSSSM